jgi:hypothetical protein
MTVVSRNSSMECECGTQRRYCPTYMFSYYSFMAPSHSHSRSLGNENPFFILLIMLCHPELTSSSHLIHPRTDSCHIHKTDVTASMPVEFPWLTLRIVDFREENNLRKLLSGGITFSINSFNPSLSLSLFFSAAHPPYTSRLGAFRFIVSK